MSKTEFSFAAAFFLGLSFVLLAGFAGFAAALTEEQSLDLLAEKTQARLNTYFSTDKIVFVKTADFVYGQTFSYAATYRITADQWRGDFFINGPKDTGFLKKGSAFNGLDVQYNDDPSELMLGFYCGNPLISGASYLVYAELSKQPNLTLDGVARALTAACVEFRDAVATASLDAIAVPAASASASSCSLVGDACCRGALCKRVTQNACPSGQTPRLTGCDVTCAPRVLCEIAPQVEPSTGPAPSVFVESSAPAAGGASESPTAPPAAATVLSGVSVAPPSGGGGAQEQSFDWVYWVLAGVALIALVYWVFFRGKEGGEGSKPKK